MKNNKIFIILIAIFFLTITACKKNTTRELTPTPPTIISADSNYISKLIFLNGSGSTIDTSINIFVYDNLKRVSQYLETFTNNINGVVSKSFDTLFFYYNNSERLPYRIVKQKISATGTFNKVENFLTYASSGNLIKDSIISSNNANGNNVFYQKISNYFYLNNKIFINSINTSNLPNNNFLERDTLTQDVNTNIISKNSYTDYGLNSPNNSSSISTYTYGNNPSPFLNLNICNRLGKFENGDYSSYFLYQGSKNNLTSLKKAAYSNGVFQVNIIVFDNLDTYNFKVNGYANSIAFQFPLSPQFKRLVYEYKTL